MTDAEVKDLHVGRDGGSKATDTMMIVHVPANGSKATIISLPRDSYVTIAGHGQDRLNAAYVYGYNDAKNNGADDAEAQTAGADLLLSTVTNLTGLTINHYVQVSLLGFYEISKAIGGVPINLCKAVDDTTAANRAAGLDGGSGFKMSKGKHTISGKTALEFVRQRHFLRGGDLDRVRRQQYFLTAAFRKVASVGLLFKLNALGDAVKRNIVLDKRPRPRHAGQADGEPERQQHRGQDDPHDQRDHQRQPGAGRRARRKVQAFVDKLINRPTSSPSPTRSTTKTSGSATSTAPKPLDSKCIN